MNNKNNNFKSVVIFIVVFLVIIFAVGISEVYEDAQRAASSNHSTSTSYTPTYYDSTFRILASQENQDLESIIKRYANQKGYDVQIDYAGTLDIMGKLNAGEVYDAVWASNSIWLYMLDKSVATNSSTHISPVVFGITKSKAEELGFVNNDTVYMQDIVDCITSGRLKFSMSNPTSTNSGATAYLGMLQVLAGNPSVLKREHLDNQELKDSLKALFSGMERSSGSDSFLEEAFLKGDYESVVTYESSIINLNKKLIAQGKEPLYAIYPVDGVSLNDNPFGYIDNKSDYKQEVYESIKNYLISDEGQAALQAEGRRTWFGGINNNADQAVFNPEWGINTTKYITPIKYPSTAVIKEALGLYQNELRKPVHVVFCLDYSGSMQGAGYRELVSAMEYVLGKGAENDFIQFTDKDVIDIVPFATVVKYITSTQSGWTKEDLIAKIKKDSPNGGTALYIAAQKGLELLKDVDKDEYNCSVILMTDGYSNAGTFAELKRYYDSTNSTVPIYSIMFGNASEVELSDIAELTNAKVFDGKQDLVQAFKEVRGYN